MRILRWGLYGILAILTLANGYWFLTILIACLPIFETGRHRYRTTKQSINEPLFGSPDSQQSSRDVYSIYKQTQFFELFGCLCKVDGVVSRDEIDAVESIFNHLGFTETEVDSAKSAFRVGKSESFEFSDALLELNQLSIGLQVAAQLLHLLNVVVANTGGGLVQKEREMLFAIGRAYGLIDSVIADILMLGNPSGDRGSQSNDDRLADKSSMDLAYERLEIDASTSLKQAERNYRRLRSRYHPDKLPANASEAQKSSAERQFNDVQRAWDIVRVHHGS